ncbi:unnamed protein product [Rotaria sordida]|uniref:Tetraspanin n=1 Tax=Rotaria sordida TaxID=392033 RepID=A0A815HUE2_9BILA|nr:unnamed protein product [Rotaria sordida]CAF4113575.1 unnamed protein product [Rotaria sordida]
MAKRYSTTCAVASTLSIITGIALLITGSVFVHDMSFLRNSWREIYAISIYSILIGILTIIFSIGLLYVVNRKFPALTIVFSILMLVVVVLTIICLAVLRVGLDNLRRDSYTNTEYLLRNHSTSNTIVDSHSIIGHIQATFGCCDVKQVPDEKNQLLYENPFSSCCVIIVTDFYVNSVVAAHTHTVGFTKDGQVKQDTINVRGFAEPVYYYLRKRYITLMVLDSILIVSLLISAILGLASEYYARQQYEPM